MSLPPSLVPPTAAALATWNASEWSTYSAAVCDAFTSSVQQGLDRHDEERERRQQEREMKGEEVQGDEEEEEEELAELTSEEETELELLIRAFTAPVKAFMEDRLLLDIGMDEKVILALSTLQAMCHHVVSHSDLLSVEAQIRILSLFPDLAGLSDAQVTLWMAHQHQKLRTLLQRIIAQHRQHSSGSGGAHSSAGSAASSQVSGDASDVAHVPFAASVLDLFTILSATVTGYFDHLSRLAPFGLSTFTAFLHSIDSCVVEYCEEMVRGMGEPHTLIPYGDDDCKLKQSEEFTPSSTSLLSKQRLQAMASRHSSIIKLQALDQANKSNVTKAMDELQLRSRVDKEEPSSVASHSIEDLCIHVASIQACGEQLQDLQQQIQLAWAQLTKKKPQIKQKAQALLSPSSSPTNASSASPPSSVSLSALQSSADALLRLSSGTVSHLFPSSTARVYEAKKKASELLSIALVFVEWRQALLLDLYNPSAAEGPRVVGGALLDAVNSRMPRIYRALQPQIFPVLCQFLLSHLCVGLSYVLVYGRRVVEQEDCQRVLLPDILAVELLFASELSALTVESCCHAYRRLLGVVGWSTEKLLAQHADFDARKSPVPRIILARILGLRKGSLVGHFIHTEREKQKREQKATTGSAHTSATSSTHSSFSPFSAAASANRKSSATGAPRPSSSSTARPEHLGDSQNPFAEEERRRKGSDGAHEEGWEVISRPPSLPTALPSSAPFPPPLRVRTAALEEGSGVGDGHANDDASSSSYSSSSSIAVTDLLSHNAVQQQFSMRKGFSKLKNKLKR